jgi:hypothetical protein
MHELKQLNDLAKGELVGLFQQGSNPPKLNERPIRQRALLRQRKRGTSPVVPDHAGAFREVLEWCQR